MESFTIYTRFFFTFKGLINVFECEQTNYLILGQIIGKVSSDGTCFMVYCDENSEVVNKTVECTSTITPEVYFI